MCKNQVFIAHEKRQFFSNSDFFGKMTDFGGLFYSDHLTHNNSQGISGKIISISLIWHPVFKNCATGEAAMTSGKSGLMYSTLKMLISVLSNKAVLDFTDLFISIIWGANSGCFTSSLSVSKIRL